MNKGILVLVLCASSFLLCDSSEPSQLPSIIRKKIAIAWSKGGGAHKSMLDALKSYFAETYEVVDFCPFEIGWASLDPIRKLTFCYYDGEDLYNCLLSNDMPWLINKLHNFGLTALRRHRNHIEKCLEDYIRKLNPELIISVIPHLNSAMADVAQRLKIPFLIIAPDLNIRTYFISEPPKDNFYYTIPFNDEIGWKTAIRCGVDPHCIMTTGFPLRLDFYGVKDHAAIRKQFSIAADKPVVMILMGGVGSSKVIKYVKRILKTIKIPLHIIVCIGKTESLRRPIERMKKPADITLSVIGFTKHISDLMSVSDVLISKPGPTSISEAIEMQLPLLLDNTSTTLEVERLHLEFIKKNNLGVVLNSYSDLDEALPSLLAKGINAAIRNRMKNFSNADFPQKITKVIQHIFKQQEKKPMLNVVS